MIDEKLFNANIGNNIKRYRKSKLLTQKDLAFKINLNSKTIERIEAGKTGIKAYDLYKIANVLNMPISKLLEERRI